MGALHGIGLVMNKLFRVIFGQHRQGMAVRNNFSLPYISFCEFLLDILQGSGYAHYVSMMLNQIFLDFLPSSFKPLLSAYAGVFALMAAGYLIHFLPEKLKESYRGLFIRIPVALQMIIVLLAAFLLYQMRTTEIIPFIYFRF